MIALLRLAREDRELFHNENTFSQLKAAGREDEFHSSYDKAVENFRRELGKTYPMIIGGVEVTSSDGTFDDTNPSKIDLVVARFQKGNREHAKQAIEAAKKAFEKWSETAYTERVRLYRLAADIASKSKYKLAAELTFDNGKNRYEAMADIDEGIDFIRYYAEQLEVNKGFDMEMGHLAPNERTRSVLRPYGVWSVISPFNFPFAITTGMSTGASITGNTIVLKPASDTPLLAYELLRIMKEAGVPDGVINFVTGSGSTVGAELIENRAIQGVVFTGSWEVGSKSLAEFEKAMPRPFIAEMGGKNATVVSEKSELDKAVEGVMRGAFGFAGQKCSACSRVYVKESIKEEFVDRLILKTAELKVGNPERKEVFLGPLINEAAYRNYQNYVEEAREAGKIAYGGRVLENGEMSNGYFVEPTIVTDLPKNHRLIRTELFVPILTVETYSELQDAIKRVNDVDYGLTSGIFSTDRKEIDTYFDKVQAGVIYANRVSGSTTGAVVGNQSFVGWKRSGSSGKGAGGPYYLQQFLREQSQTIYT
ncbi:MAG: aldehyde dehydrogenase family protein [Thaumarchaeota archaeon]|nr:aldehyde dehydrogenase family protein [Nitrososphaerota archaeon]